MMSKSRLVPWLGFGAALFAASLLWHGGPSRRPTDKTPPPADAELAAAGEVDRTQLIVDFKDDVSSETLANNGFTEVPISDYSAKDRLYRLEFSSAGEAAAAMARLSHDPSVESVDYESFASISPDEEEATASAAAGSMETECQGSAAGTEFPNDACYKYQWHLRQLGMPDAWKRGNGKGVVVAVIDTGVSKVADLADTQFVAGYNFLSNNDNAADDHGHGTHVAGTIAQSTNNKLGVAGVAYGASIMPLKVLSARGSGSVAGIAQAIRWAADHGASVINMSLGGPIEDGQHGQRREVRARQGRRHRRGRGQRRAGQGRLPGRLPGGGRGGGHAVRRDHDLLFELGQGDRRRGAGRQHPRRPERRRQARRRPPAHRRSRQTSQTDYLWFMGTSMASPHAAGVAALVVGAGVTKPDAVEEILLGTARKPKGAKQTAGRVDDHYGAGIVDASAALTKARDGRGAGELGLATAVSLLGMMLMRRRGVALTRLGPGFVAALIVGSSGLFFLPGLLPQSWSHAHAVGRSAVGRLHRHARRRARVGRQPAGVQRGRPAGADRAALRRQQAAPGAGGVRLRCRGGPVVRGRQRHGGRPLTCPTSSTQSGWRRTRG